MKRLQVFSLPIFLVLFCLFSLFITACDIATSDEIAGEWVSWKIISGIQVEDQLSLKADGSFSWVCLEDKIVQGDHSFDGTWVQETGSGVEKDFKVIFQNSEEGALPLSSQYMITNNGGSLYLVMLGESFDTAYFFHANAIEEAVE